jgi:hypothetical protein
VVPWFSTSLSILSPYNSSILDALDFLENK